MASSSSSCPSPTIHSFSCRQSRDLEDTLIFEEDLKLVKDWYNRHSSNGSTTIKRIQLRVESAMPFHQFIVIQTHGELGGTYYRVDRGREREGWSIFDTIKKLGVPPRDTIAVLQQPVEELDKTSECVVELPCTRDKNIDLSFVLGICFRIHNNWGRRYNLITHNCYFFARTIITVCDDKLDNDSSRVKSIWRHIPEALYERLAMLLWALGWTNLWPALQLVHFGKVSGLVFGLLLGSLNQLLILLPVMQIHVALAVRVVVGKVIEWERELELEQRGVPVLEQDEAERTRAMNIILDRIEQAGAREQEQRRGWVRARMQVLTVLKWVLIIGVTHVLPLALTLALIMPIYLLGPPSSNTFGEGLFIGQVGVMVLSPWLVWLGWFFCWCSACSRGVCSRFSSDHPLDKDVEMGCAICVNAAGRPEPLTELGDGSSGSATATEADQTDETRNICYGST